MKPIGLTAFGTVESGVIDGIETEVQRTFGVPVQRLPGLPVPPSAWDPERGQFSSPLFLRALLDTWNSDQGSLRLLALTEADLFIPMLTFVYGQAQLDGQTGIVSLARLRQEFYGMAANPALLLARAAKEALHELGHTFGLIHCPEESCIMALATNIGQLDRKDVRLCADCRVLAGEAVRRALHEETA